MPGKKREMAIAVGNTKLEAKMTELRSLRKSLAQTHYDPIKRRHQQSRLPRLQEEIRRLLLK